MPKCTINGQEVEVAEGTTIIEAFKQLEQDIAHYCWHPGLSIAGVCRMCAVEVEGVPKLQIACNTTVQEGMVISNKSEKVDEAVKWVLEFHLINHPLDCPICDQAGECGLQEHYMTYGKYDPAMGENKVKKRKVVDLGERVVLDTERCILCSRCVRFTDEVSKSHELGIFNRGDRSEIGTYEDRPLNNDYSLNTVDVCPVGALTSKDFRFRQRVWFLEESETVCTGCSTGCNVKVYFNENGLYRVRPVYNEEINGHWMCDVGRETYKWVNIEYRQKKAEVSRSGKRERLNPMSAAVDVGRTFKDLIEKEGSNSFAVVLTGQYTCEENEALLDYCTKVIGTKNVFHWINNPESFEDFDQILLRGDKNPNTKGVLNSLQSRSLSKAWGELESGLSNGTIKTVIVAGPENQAVYKDIKEKIELFKKAENVVWFTACKNPDFIDFRWVIPTKSFFEKSGTFINYKGIEQKIKPGTQIVESALTLVEAAQLMSGMDATRKDR